MAGFRGLLYSLAKLMGDYNAVNAASQDPHEKSRVIYEKVNELALEPFVAPDPLPPIYDDEIQLVCWMAISVD